MPDHVAEVRPALADFARCGVRVDRIERQVTDRVAADFDQPAGMELRQFGRGQRMVGGRAAAVGACPAWLASSAGKLPNPPGPACGWRLVAGASGAPGVSAPRPWAISCAQMTGKPVNPM